MDTEVIALINSGATTLLGLMVTDAWDRAKRSARAIFSQNDADESSPLADDLEASRARLREAREAGDEDSEVELAAEWRSRIRRAIEQDPQAEEALRNFVTEYGPVAGTERNSSAIRIEATVKDHGRVYQQGHGNQYNY